MAGPLDIQRLPRSLADLLGMQASGQTPQRLSQDVQPIIDVSELYVLDRQRRRTFTAGIAPAANGVFTGGATSGPPSGYVWYVYDVSFYTPTAVAAAATAAYALAIQYADTQVLLIDNMDTGVLAAGASASRSRHFERPFIMQPGDLFGWRVYGLTGAPAVNPSATIQLAEVAI